MHCLSSLWKGGEPLFYDEKGYAGLSDVARWYIGGLLEALLRRTGVRQPHGQLLPPSGEGYEAP
ncbi:hypothetical protein QJS66_05170 [Kocuria rhizophila]|nr:hypothetical protein QJS66_05170 [Kocuria rhizophila]